MSDDDAARALGAWAREQRITVAFEVRRVNKIEVLFVLLAAILAS